MDEIKKIKISGGIDKTVTWIWLDPETGGQFKVEYYDFSDSAQGLFGNDIAYTFTVQDMDKLLSNVNQNEVAIIPWMEQYFKSYLGIKKWLEEHGINFGIEIEGWA